MAAAEYVNEIGISECTIYNSINMSIDSEEIEVLKNSDITSSIILGFNPTQPDVNGKMDIWENGSGIIDKGLLEIASDCGIIKPLMDVAVKPLGQGGGVAIKATLNEKSKWGYPAGSGVHNVPSAWQWIKNVASAIWDGLCAAWQGFVNIVMSLVLPAFNAIWAPISKIIEAFQGGGFIAGIKQIGVAILEFLLS